MAVYDAFLSYSHAKDKSVAAALQSVVQKLGKPWYRRRSLRIFRDDTSLSATPELWPSIEQALRNSRFFLLLASPEAAASKWVNKEVSHWLDHNGVETLLIGVTDGEISWDEHAGDFAASANSPLPPALLGRFRSEPKWVDLRIYRDGANPSDARFIEVAADFAAAIHGMPKEDLLSQEVLQQRRALRQAWSAASALLILAVAATAAGVLAYQAKQQAVRSEQLALTERDNANRNFKLAKGTADDLVYDIAQGLRNVQGMRADSVRKILDTAKATFDQLAASAPDDLDIQVSRGSMLEAFGDTYLTVGDLVSALNAYTEFFTISQRLANAKPDKVDWQRNLALSHEKIGNTLLALGKREDALAAYQKSLSIMQGLVEKDPGNVQWRQDLAVNYQNVGKAVFAAGKRDEALAFYERALAINEKLTEGDPSNTNLLIDLSVTYDRIGSVLVKTEGKREEALATYQKALAVWLKIAASDEGNAVWQRSLSVSYEQVGDLLLVEGKDGEALETYETGLTIRRKLADSDPDNVVWQRDISTSYDRIGNVLVAEGKREEALAARQKSLSIAQKLADSDPTNTQWQSDLSLQCTKVGDVLRTMGKLKEALDFYQKSLAVAQKLADSDPGNAQWQRDLVLSITKVAGMQRLAGAPQEALPAFQKALAIMQKLAEVDPGNAEWQHDLYVCYIQTAGALPGEEREQALADYQKSFVIAQKLAEADSGNAATRRDLRLSIRFIGDEGYSFILARDFVRALEIIDQAISLAPDMIWLNLNRAHALMFLGRLEEARALYFLYRGEKDEFEGKVWEDVILEDFAELKKAGITNPLMDDIETKLTRG